MQNSVLTNHNQFNITFCGFFYFLKTIPYFKKHSEGAGDIYSSDGLSCLQGNHNLGEKKLGIMEEWQEEIIEKSAYEIQFLLLLLTTTNPTFDRNPETTASHLDNFI